MKNFLINFETNANNFVLKWTKEGSWRRAILGKIVSMLTFLVNFIKPKVSPSVDQSYSDKKVTIGNLEDHKKTKIESSLSEIDNEEIFPTDISSTNENTETSFPKIVSFLHSTNDVVGDDKFELPGYDDLICQIRISDGKKATDKEVLLLTKPKMIPESAKKKKYSQIIISFSYETKIIKLLFHLNKKTLNVSVPGENMNQSGFINMEGKSHINIFCNKTRQVMFSSETPKDAEILEETKKFLEFFKSTSSSFRGKYSYPFHNLKSNIFSKPDLVPIAADKLEKKSGPRVR